jgi:hypothetical protein
VRGAIEYVIIETCSTVFDERVHLFSTPLQYKLSALKEYYFI